MSHFNEHSLEMAIMELFEQQGYAYQNGETVHKELSEVLLDDLRMFLADRYADEGITPLEIERVIAHLTADTGASLYEQNAHVHRLMTEGFTVKREDAALPDLFVVPIDFEHSDRNLFKIVNQLEIKGTEKRIPDGIVYVNGLPVVVLEFKSAVKEETTIMDAFTQLTVRYRRDIPNLFRYNAFVVISDGGEQQIRHAVLALRLLLCVAQGGALRQSHRRHQFVAHDDGGPVPHGTVAECRPRLCLFPRQLEKGNQNRMPLSAVLCHASAV